MRGQRNDGFSLAEMLVALSIVSLVMIAFLVNPFSAKRELSIDHVARQIASKLNSAGARAVSNGHPVEVMIDLENSRMSFEGEDLRFPDSLQIQFRTGVELLESGRKGSLLFLADGSASGGEIVLKALTGQTRAIRINWVTGSVHVSRGA